MVVSRSVLVESKMFGMRIHIELSDFPLTKSHRGAYCAMVIIALLNLPLELPQDAEARKYGFNTFLDGLPEYLSRCEGSNVRS